MNARGTFRRIVCCALTALLLLSGIQPYSAAAEPEDRRDHIIVSLGDSYASGEGIPPFYGQDDIKQWSLNKPLDWLAHRSMSSWSGRLTLHPSVSGTMADYPGTHWFFVAASGAKTKDLQHPQKKKVNNTNLDALANLAAVMPFTDYYFELPPQLEVFDYLDANGLKADYVTVSLGGNDVYFADIVTKAAIEGSYISFYSLQKKIEKIWEEFDSTIQYRIRDAYKLIADRAGPQAAVLVVGYPGLINPKGSKVFFNDWEAQYIDAQVSLFNERLREIVRSLHDDQHCNIHFVSVEEAFFEHEAYSEKPSYMNGIIMPAQPYDLDITKPVSDYSMHPNWEGARVYAECVQKKINELEALRDTSTPPAANTNQGRADADLWGAINRSGVCGYISKTFDEIDAQTGELEGVEVEYELGLRNLYFFKGSSILYSFETDLSEIELSTETGFLPGSLVRKYLKGTDRCNGVALRQLSLIGFTGEVNAKDVGAEVYQNEEYEDLWMAFAKHDGCDFVFICDDSSGTISKDSYCWFSKDLPAQATQTPAQTNRNGWVNEGRSAESWEEGEWYYYSSGRPITGWQTIDGETYYFLSDGRMAQSITEINGTRYYFKEHFYGAGPSTGSKPEHGALSHGGYEQRSDSSMVYCDSKGRVIAYDGMVNGQYFEFALAAFSLIWDEDRLAYYQDVADYGYYDIDGDGYPEFYIKRGASEKEYVYEFYKAVFSERKYRRIGVIEGANSKLEWDDPYLYFVTTQSGKNVKRKIEIINGRIELESTSSSQPTGSATKTSLAKKLLSNVHAKEIGMTLGELKAKYGPLDYVYLVTEEPIQAVFKNGDVSYYFQGIEDRIPDELWDEAVANDGIISPTSAKKLIVDADVCTGIRAKFSTLGVSEPNNYETWFTKDNIYHDELFDENYYVCKYDHYEFSTRVYALTTTSNHPITGSDWVEITLQSSYWPKRSDTITPTPKPTPRKTTSTPTPTPRPQKTGSTPTPTPKPNPTSRWRYDPYTALNAAETVLNTIEGKGATYVSRLLREGGLTKVKQSVAGDLIDYLNKPKNWGGERIGAVVLNPSYSDLEVGDILCSVCSNGSSASDFTNGHGEGKNLYYGIQVFFISEVGPDYIRVYSKNTDRHNEIIYLSCNGGDFIDKCGKCGNSKHVHWIAFCFSDDIKP